jgi:hypothetical protein
MARDFAQHKATQLVRYSIPAGVTVVGVEGVCMWTTRYFMVRGILKLNGVIRLGGKL